MAEIKSLTRNQNYDNNLWVPWSDLNHDVLLLVMMKLEAVDFLAFRGVCKPWRSLALPNRKMFMDMSISISTQSDEKECYLELEDFEGRKFKTLLPSFSAGRKCVGLTCGYLILFGEETKDFWLVNPITRHQLRFPDFPYHAHREPRLKIRGILVFSPLVSEWLFVVTERSCGQVWYSAGKGVWNNVHVSTTCRIHDIHAFKGKIYTLISDCRTPHEYLYEMRFGTDPKLILLETKNFPKINFGPQFVSSDETLHVLTYFSGYAHKVHKLESGEMKWVHCKKTNEEYVIYINDMNHMATVVKPELWAGTNKTRYGRAYAPYMWYFPHECLNVNLIDE